jgi:hypothetical protein
MKIRMPKLRSFIVQVLILLSLSGYAQTGDANAHIEIIVQLMFNDSALQLTGQPYVNSMGDTLYIDLFRFYMTGIIFTGPAGATNAHCSKCDRLVDVEYEATQSIIIDVPEGTYDKLSFTLGVDSMANTSGANGGDLDPVKGMYWAWNSGYIMAKMEGRSRVCKTLHNAYEYHIGGYMPPYNTARQVTLKLPKPLHPTSSAPATVYLSANAATWFTGIDLRKENNITIPGKAAMEMAGRYATMVTVQQ